MKNITLGSTGITVPQNAFGALPVQRVDIPQAVEILRAAYDGGMTFFDTARAYSDSEEKIGLALSSVRSKINIATPPGSNYDVGHCVYYKDTDNKMQSVILTNAVSKNSFEPITRTYGANANMVFNNKMFIGYNGITQQGSMSLGPSY